MGTFEWAPTAKDDLCDIAAAGYDDVIRTTVLPSIRKAAPVGITRQLRNRGLTWERKGRGVATEWVITARALSEEGFNYAPAVITGRKAFSAAPGKVLSWIDKETRKRVFAKSVRATVGNNFLFKGLRDAGLRQVRDNARR